MSEQALRGVRVVDLSMAIAGPYCTKILASLGAEVIKIEPPGFGDEARRMGPFSGDDPHPEKSGTFLYLNTGKKSVTLDITTVTGRKLLLDLVRQADVLVESFAPSEMPGWGLSYEQLSAVSPRLIVTSISAFGQTGPYRDYRANDIIIYAYGGQLYMTGEPDREPLKNGGQQGQNQAGMIAYLGTLTALLARRLTGEGQHVDISMMEAVASALEHATIIWSYVRELNDRTGNHFRAMSAWGIYPAKDGYVAVCSGTGDSWRRFADLMDEPRLSDPRYDSGKGRQEFRDEIDALMMPWLATHGKDEIFHKAQAMRLPFGMVCTTEDILNSTHLQERGYFVEIDHPNTGKVVYPGSPFVLSETPARYQRAPLLGEHNQEVLGGLLELSKLDLVRLRERGVI